MELESRDKRKIKEEGKIQRQKEREIIGKKKKERKRQSKRNEKGGGERGSVKEG